MAEIAVATAKPDKAKKCIKIMFKITFTKTIIVAIFTGVFVSL